MVAPALLGSARSGTFFECGIVVLYVVAWASDAMMRFDEAKKKDLLLCGDIVAPFRVEPSHLNCQYVVVRR